MFSAFQTFGRLGAGARAVSAAWSPLALWPLGASSPGMWTDPPYTASLFSTSAGTTPISAIGTVLDTSNPVGLVLDRKGGATALADPGIHLSQATATSRPVASARVNLLTYSEDFSNAAWTKNGTTVSANAITAPDGTLTADAIVENAATSPHRVYSATTTTANPTFYVCAKKGTRDFLLLQDIGGAKKAWFDLNTGVVGTKSAGVTSQITSLGNGWYLCSASINATSSIYLIEAANADNSATYTGVNGNTAIYIWGAQLNLGSTALPYQRVGAASDYDASAGPTYLKFDGVDDSLATATFSAGTLTSSMDCLMAVRRDSAGNVILISDTGSRGFAEWVSGDANRPDVSAGTPTYLVDGAAITATRGALFTALTAGSWHILEVRGLDLTTWTALNVSALASYRLNGGISPIQLFASGQDANRDLARAQMAAYFGVTLP